MKFIPALNFDCDQLKTKCFIWIFNKRGNWNEEKASNPGVSVSNSKATYFIFNSLSARKLHDE